MQGSTARSSALSRSSIARTFRAAGPVAASFGSMVPEAKAGRAEEGLGPKGEGWFVLNARDARWFHVEGRAADLPCWKASPTFRSSGSTSQVLWPGQGMAMYHWEADQEGFLVLSGEALLIVEGEERPLRPGTTSLPARHEARDRRGRERAVHRGGGRRPRPLGRQPGLGRLHRRRGRATARRRGRRGDERSGERVRELDEAPAGATARAGSPDLG